MWVPSVLARRSVASLRQLGRRAARSRARSAGAPLWLLLGILILGTSTESLAQGGSGDGTSAKQPEKTDAEGGETPRRGSLGLDSLLRPRAGAPQEPGQPRREATRADRDREGWQKAFAEVRAEIRDIEARLDKSREKVGAVSRSEYQYSPIGGGEQADPEVLKLRAAIRRDRKALDEAQTRLRELQVEASLAGVPEEWTRESGAAAPPARKPAPTTAPAPKP